MDSSWASRGRTKCGWQPTSWWTTRATLGRTALTRGIRSATVGRGRGACRSLSGSWPWHTGARTRRSSRRASSRLREPTVRTPPTPANGLVARIQPRPLLAEFKAGVDGRDQTSLVHRRNLFAERTPEPASRIGPAPQPVPAPRIRDRRRKPPGPRAPETNSRTPSRVRPVRAANVRHGSQPRIGQAGRLERHPPVRRRPRRKHGFAQAGGVAVEIKELHAVRPAGQSIVASRLEEAVHDGFVLQVRAIDDQGEVVGRHFSSPPSAHRWLRCHADSFRLAAATAWRGQRGYGAWTRSTLGSPNDHLCRNASGPSDDRMQLGVTRHPTASASASAASTSFFGCLARRMLTAYNSDNLLAADLSLRLRRPRPRPLLPAPNRRASLPAPSPSR